MIILIDVNGCKGAFKYQNDYDVYHNEYGPAYRYWKDDVTQYFIHGGRHNTNGPAYISTNVEQYYINGVWFPKRVWMSIYKKKR